MATWIETANKTWGTELIGKIMQETGWAKDRIIMPTEDISDSEVKSLSVYWQKQQIKRKMKFG